MYLIRPNRIWCSKMRQIKQIGWQAHLIFTFYFVFRLNLAFQNGDEGPGIIIIFILLLFKHRSVGVPRT